MPQAYCDSNEFAIFTAIPIFLELVAVLAIVTKMRKVHDAYWMKKELMSKRL